MAVEFAAGDLVRVSNPARGAVVSTVVHVTTPAALPSLPHHDLDELKTHAARAILQEWCVDTIALIQYRWNGPPRPRDVAFVALQIGGNWWDLKRQTLTITLLWRELADAVAIHGPASGAGLWQLSTARWTLTSHGAAVDQVYTTASGDRRTPSPSITTARPPV